jgi:hypothetical protein
LAQIEKLKSIPSLPVKRISPQPILVVKLIIFDLKDFKMSAFINQGYNGNG